MWDKGWDNVFENSRWGRYPPEELLRFMARNFYNVPDRSKVSVLEVGCGPGANLWYIAREGFSTFGMDGSEVALSRAKERCEEENVLVDLRQADAMQLPYEDQSIDAVYELECVYANSLKDSKKIISEIHRVLKPGGMFFSKTFSTGSDGDGRGTLVENEPHTYIDITDSVIHDGYGIIRFTAEEEIPQLYGVFSSIEYEYIVRSDNNRNHEIREWLITCKK